MVIEEQPAWAQNSGLEPSASQALLFSLSHWYLWEAAGAGVVAEALGLSAWTAFLNNIVTSNLGLEAVLKV